MRIRSLMLIGIALACAEPLAPGDVLVGTWSNTTTHGYPIQLAASATGADLSTSCTTAHFPALRLDDSLSFQATGVYTRAIGLVAVRVGDPATIAGQALGPRLVVHGDTLDVGRSGASVKLAARVA